MNTPQTWSDSPIHEQIKIMNDTPTPISDQPTYAMLANAMLAKMKDRAKIAENQLTAVTEQLDSYKERYTKLAGKYAIEMHEITEQRDRLLEEREQWRLSSVCRELTEQRDMLAEALRELCIALLTDKSPDITDLLNKAGAAMAAVNYSTAKKSQP